MKIPAQSVTALTEFGYVEREAQFLYLVAVHSGFFVQRQFIEYSGVSGRGPITDFLRKAIQRKHVREHLPERGSQKIYHLFSRRLYASIEKEHSRNRKTGRYGLLDKASVRLLSLDFVLSHLDHLYLEEETQKVAYFTEEKRIAATILPAKTFHGQQGPETRRYFIERFPIFLSDIANEQIVNFTYLEDELRSLQTFRSFVERYRPLFEGLNGNFKLIFVSNSSQSFPDAKKAFLDIFSSRDQERETRRLARFFWLRRMAEQKRFKDLVHKDVIDWQRGLKQYSSADHEEQYQTWNQTGKLPQPDPGKTLTNPARQFETYLVVPRTLRPPSTIVGEAAGLPAETNASVDAGQRF